MRAVNLNKQGHRYPQLPVAQLATEWQDYYGKKPLTPTGCLKGAKKSRYHKHTDLAKENIMQELQRTRDVNYGGSERP